MIYQQPVVHLGPVWMRLWRDGWQAVHHRRPSGTRCVVPVDCCDSICVLGHDVDALDVPTMTTKTTPTTNRTSATLTAIAAGYYCDD